MRPWGGRGRNSALGLGQQCGRVTDFEFARAFDVEAFHSAKTIELLDFERTPGVSRASVNDLLTCRFIGGAAPVHIVGPVGTGKAISRRQSGTRQSGSATRCTSPRSRSCLAR